MPCKNGHLSLSAPYLSYILNVDVLNAQQQFNATQRDLSKAKYASLINMLELQAVAGQLNAETVQQINQLLVQ